MAISEDTQPFFDSADFVDSRSSDFWLIWLRGTRRVQVPVRHGSSIGRDGDCDINLGSSQVSRHHAKLVREGSLWIVHDTASRNGTFVCGKRVQHAPVKVGDLLRVGDCLAVFSDRKLVWQTCELATGLLAGPELAGLLEPARTVSRSNHPIVITGETGTGKERVARAIHEWSARKGPFHALNCAALPANLAEAEPCFLTKSTASHPKSKPHCSEPWMTK